EERNSLDKGSVAENCYSFSSDYIANEAHHFNRSLLRHAESRQRQDRVARAHSIHDLPGQRRHLKETLLLPVPEDSILAARDKNLAAGKLVRYVQHQLPQVTPA